MDYDLILVAILNGEFTEPFSSNDHKKLIALFMLSKFIICSMNFHEKHLISGGYLPNIYCLPKTPFSL